MDEVKEVWIDRWADIIGENMEGRQQGEGGSRGREVAGEGRDW